VNRLDHPYIMAKGLENLTYCIQGDDSNGNDP